MKPKLVYLYIVASTSSHDHVTCHVPYKLSDSRIFFGSCKKRLRDELKKTPEIFDTHEVYLVGLSGSKANKQGEQTRKVIWAGMINKVMTFAEAYERYSIMPFDGEPITHLKPKYTDGQLTGYTYCGLAHHSDSKIWQSDYEVKGKPLSRDICFECDNLFFADGQGIMIDNTILDIVNHSRSTNNTEPYYIFGKQSNGTAEGLTGGYTIIKDKLADKFIQHLKEISGHDKLSSASPIKRSYSGGC